MSYSQKEELLPQHLKTSTPLTQFNSKRKNRSRRIAFVESAKCASRMLPLHDANLLHLRPLFLVS